MAYLAELVRPLKLAPGDKVAVVSPSWGGAGQFPHRHEAGKRQLAETFNVQVVDMPHATKLAAWVAQNPKARAEDIMVAFADPSIKAIITAIGGDDSIRLLPYLDLNVITDNPKIFMGYSDTTILHFACLTAGLSSFYGPAIMAGFGENGGLFPYMEQAVRKCLFSSEPVGAVPAAAEWTVEMLDWAKPELQSQKRKLQPALGRTCLQGSGKVQGRLVGGCIDVLPMLVGTSIWPDSDMFDDAILFIETSEEAPAPNAIKRILRNLGVQGIFDRLNGILIGRPGGGVKDLRQYDRATQEVVRDEFAQPSLPIMAQLDFGHTDPMCVLPYGALAEIDCDNLQFSILEPACRED
ncbi:S66 family peptidase [Maritalea myrionectae]|uniref:S66 family peptidase n=1 Tax=Maritalea myrionectae TaxID=454601 RepID=UPI0004818996|nr:S66 peptidase family protein [Maritalea myrionectae]